MIRCKCGGKTRVSDTRPLGEGIWRKRKCNNCTDGFTTFEQVCSTLDAPKGAVKGTTKANPIALPQRRIVPIKAPAITRNMVRSEPPGPRISSRNALEDARMKKELDDGSY
jgi:hypothetical protein